VRFLIDAQLPARFALWLNQHNHDALHTSQLPRGNRTRDDEIVACAVNENRIVVTKDSDFVQTFYLTGHPSLLLISTGNIRNTELESLIKRNLTRIEDAFETFRFVEITRSAIVIHE
jgi:predicted nuclease of predicted toxin-antitoxin system